MGVGQLFAEELNLYRSKVVFSLQLWSQVDWADCFISHQNTGGNEKLSHYSLTGMVGRPVRNGLVTYELPIILCSGGITIHSAKT